MISHKINKAFLFGGYIFFIHSKLIIKIYNSITLVYKNEFIFCMKMLKKFNMTFLTQYTKGGIMHLGNCNKAKIGIIIFQAVMNPIGRHFMTEQLDKHPVTKWFVII